MSAHIALPGIDSGRVRPGTVVPSLLGGMLRDSLGFKGLVVTDALNMNGIASQFGAEAAVRAFVAGADLLLQPADPAATLAAMERAVTRGEVTEERLDRSVRRVLELKRRIGLFDRRLVSLDSIPLVVGRVEFQARARAMAAQSIVLVKDVGGVVHDLHRLRPALTLVTYAEEDNRTVGAALAAELHTLGYAITTFKLWPSSGPASYDSAAALLSRAQTALFATADRPVAYRGAIGLPAPLTATIEDAARRGPTILVSLGNPYVITGVPSVGSYLIGWRSNPAMEQAVARALAGAAPITGRLPISIPPLYPIRWGVQRRVTIP
jgi:beta-N-acetylhexosaminidase